MPQYIYTNLVDSTKMIQYIYTNLVDRTHLYQPCG